MSVLPTYFAAGENTDEIHLRNSHQYMHVPSQPKTRDPLTTRHWPLVVFAITAGVLFLTATLVTGLTVGLTDVHLAWRILLACAVTIFGGGTVGGAIAAMQVSANGQQLRQTKSSLKRHMDRVAEERLAGLARLTTLDDDMRAQVQALGRAFTALLDESCRRMGSEMHQVRQGTSDIAKAVALQTALVREIASGLAEMDLRVAELEQRVDGVEQTVAQAAKAENIVAGALNGNGQVHTLRRR